MQFIQQIIKNLEEKKTPLLNYFIAFAAIVFMRNILEFTLFKKEFLGERFIHYSVFYIVILLGLALIFHMASKESYAKIFKVLIPLYIIVLSPVIIDKLINLHSNIYMLGYLQPNDHLNFWAEYLTFAQHRVTLGATTGTKVEVISTIIFTFLYLRIKEVKFFNSIIAAIASYTLIFSIFSVLIFTNFISRITHLTYDPTDIFMTNLFIIVITIVTLIITYQTKPKIFIAILKKLKSYHTIYFFLLITFGIWLSLLPGHGIKNLSNLFQLINAYIAGILIYLSTIFLNKSSSIESNQENSQELLLTEGLMRPKNYQNIAIGLGTLGLIISATINFTSFITMTVFIALISFYSIEPFKLKNYAFVGKLIYSLSCLGLAMFGFSVLNPNIYDFPTSVGYILIFSFLIMSFLDLKDVPGDTLSKFKTLPILIGSKWAKRLIGIFFIATYIVIYYFFKPSLFILVLLIFFGLVQYLLINKKSYEEKYVYATYILSFITFWALYALFFK